MKQVLILYSIFIFLNNVHGQNIQDLKNEKTVTVTGGIGVTTTGYTASGIAARRVPFSWMANANLNIKLKGFDLPFSFTLTKQQRDFRQPFNQFGLSPKWKNIQLHLGWRSLAYSNYTLNNFQFLGAGVNVKLKNFVVGAMAGRFLKAINEDSSKTILNSGSQVPLAAYNRTGYAVKLGYGSTQNFIHLILLKAKDDAASLIAKPIKTVTAPAENAVIGIKSKLTVAKKIFWETDAAFSAYTRDTRAEAYPLQDEPTLQKFAFLFTPKLSSSYYYAGESAIGWNDKAFGVKLKYQRVLPDYKSMGTYFMQTDLDRKIIEGKWADAKNTVSLNGSVGIESDNLTNKKNASTKRNIGSFGASYNPNPKFGVNLNWTTYGTTQSPGLKSINDTVKLDQVTNSLILTPRYTLMSDKMVQNFVLNISSQNLNDNNKLNSQNYNMNVQSATFSYVLSFLKTGLSVDASPYIVNSKNAAGNTKSIGASVGASKSFLANKNNNNFNVSYSTNTFNNTANGYTLQARLSSGYRVDKHHRVQLQLIHVINESKNTLSSRSFNESTGVLSYGYTF